MSESDWLSIGAIRGRRKVRVYFPTCEQCGRTFCAKSLDHQRFCSRECRGAFQRVRPDGDPRVRRQRRDMETAGLPEHRRRKLLAKWRRQGRACIYCAGACDTIDHVVPLIRGGTNFEGNLAPCCKACNSSKAARLLVEWRAGLPAGKTFTVAPLRVVRKRELEIKLVMKVQRACDICGSMFVGRMRHCSDECMLESNRRVNRDRYRAAHGLPGIGEPTSKWRQEQTSPRRRRRRRAAVPVDQLELIA